MLVLDFNASEYSQGLIDDDIDISQVNIYVVNIGGGTALNTRFDKIGLYDDTGHEVAYRLPNTSTVFATHRERLAVSEYWDGKRVRGGHPHPLLIPNMVVGEEGKNKIWYDTDSEKTHWKDHKYQVSIKYQDKFSNKYVTKLQVSKDGMEIKSHRKKSKIKKR